MFFTRKFKKLFSFLALLLWVHLDVYTAYAFARQSAAQLASIKLTPISLPASSAEDPDFGNLFDRNTETAYAPASPALIDVPFE
ncbi:MAG: hypothetical protein D3922_15940, partial [Candidatus Electrothrix sp. AR1]|nr:hypothetical protein [Candidatus Electrothrix sp. AR1]